MTRAMFVGYWLVLIVIFVDNVALGYLSFEWSNGTPKECAKCCHENSINEANTSLQYHDIVLECLWDACVIHTVEDD